MATARTDSGPNAALWLAIGIPVLTIIASVVTLYVAAIRAEPELPPNYHWEGSALDADIARSERAAALGVTVLLRLGDDGRIEADLRTHDPADQPAQLSLLLTHATLPAQDRRLTLQRDADGVYRARTAAIPRAHWLLELGVAGRWRVRGNLPATSRSTLLGRASG
jgi:hypothetical protein